MDGSYYPVYATGIRLKDHKYFSWEFLFSGGFQHYHPGFVNGNSKNLRPINQSTTAQWGGNVSYGGLCIALNSAMNQTVYKGGTIQTKEAIRKTGGNWQIGDRIGFKVHCKKREVEYFRNGISCGIIFQGLGDCIVPCVNSYTQNKLHQFEIKATKL